MSDQDPMNPGEDQPGTPPPPPPPPPSGAPAPPDYGAAAGGTADVGIRLGARVIDILLLWFISAIILVPLFVGAILTDAAGGGGAMIGPSLNAAGIIGGLISLAITFGYYILMDTKLGKTVGKMLLNLEVRGAAGGLPTVEESFKRNAWMLLQIIPFIGGLLQLAAAIYIAVTISNNPANVGWHDDFAGGTRVVKTG